MLSQEELDKLLDEDNPEAIDTSGDTGDTDVDAENSKGAGASETKGPINQDDIDSLLEQELGSDQASVEAKNQEKDDLDWGDAFAEAAAGGDSAAAKAVSEGVVAEEAAPEGISVPPGPGAASPSFDEFSRNDTLAAAEHKDNLNFILELPLEVSVELGRKKIQIKDLLKLGQGSVVELNKMAGEPAEIYVNQKLMAKGEVVVVNEKFGIKLSEIISPADRVKSLG